MDTNDLDRSVKIIVPNDEQCQDMITQASEQLLKEGGVTCFKNKMMGYWQARVIINVEELVEEEE